MTHLKYVKFTTTISCTLVIARCHYASHSQRHQALQCTVCNHMQRELILGCHVRFEDIEPAVQPFRAPLEMKNVNVASAQFLSCCEKGLAF